MRQTATNVISFNGQYRIMMPPSMKKEKEQKNFMEIRNCTKLQLKQPRIIPAIVATDIRYELVNTID